MPCRWLERDVTGRPRCQHGWAHKASAGRWRCREKHRLNNLRWSHTESGREAKRRKNATAAAKLSKVLYELTRVRI